MMEKSYKFRIYPTQNQTDMIQRTFGCCRYVYNHFLAKRIDLYRDNGKTLNYSNCSAELTKLKKENVWLREVDAIALQSSLRDLDLAYQNFFRRVRQCEKPGFPKFKSKKNRRKSYKTKCVNNNIIVFDNRIKLPKLGLVKTAISKQVEGRILNATISQAPSGKYYVSICCTEVIIKQYAATGKMIGIDLGLKTLAVTSENVEFTNNHYLKKSAKKLAKAQRSLSRKQIGSNNREKARVKVARIQEQIANQRLDSIHKMTNRIIKDYDIICVEDLHVKGMMKNRKLVKHISDASWGEVIRQFNYKAQWHNKTLVEVDRFFPSSQLCYCGYRNSDAKDLSVRIWICPECKLLNERDVNAARNILNEGLRVLAG